MRSCRSSILWLVLAASLSGCASEAGVRGAVTLRVGGPPPPLRREVVLPRPGPGYSWVAGHWSARGRDYVWVAGRWTRPPRPDAVWVPPRYERRRGSWVMIGGYWRG